LRGYVFVTMVEVRVMRVPVLERFMPVPMGMGLRHGPFVSMSMMLIVDVPVFVLEPLVLMLVSVPLVQMKP
jgi:hypothetical protein